MAKANKELIFEVGSGNVFADLGLPNAEELGTKLRLCVAINKILEKRKLTQAQAARLLGVNQPKVSALKGYKLEGFSVERLMHFATSPRGEPRRGASAGGWSGIERREEWRSGSDHPPHRSKSARRGHWFASSRDVPISESRVEAPVTT
jgi:predicted XRE-type DNA-binding protein